MFLMILLMLYLSNLIFLNYKKFLLMNLIGLEFMMISICNLIFYFLMKFNLQFYLIYLLVFFVCESILGLSLLIILVRYHGNDKIKFLNLILYK